MMQPSKSLRVVAMGFWISCVQSDFFHHKDDIDILAQMPSDHHLFPLEPNHIETSMFRRLMTVLYHKQYQYAYPVPFHRTDRRKELVDPDTIVFAANVVEIPKDEESQPPQNTAPVQQIHWDFTKTPKIHGLVLIVNSYGFYTWLVAYETDFAASATHNDIQREAEPVREVLQDHIINLVGGSYFSHFSGLEKEA